MNSLKLYHYTSTTAAQSIIDSGELWLSDVDTLPDRDGTEILTRFRIFKEQVISSRGFKKLSKSNQSKFIEWFIDNLLKINSIDRTQFFIACFCLSNKNKHLWDNHAYKQSGKALEFEFPMPVDEKSRFPLQGFFMNYRNPVHCEELQSKLDGLIYPDFDEWIQIINRVRKGRKIKLLHKQKGYLHCRDTLCDAFIRYCLATKEEKFKEECEFRLVASSGLFATWFDERRIDNKNGRRVMKFPIPDGFFTGTIYEVEKST